MTKLELVIKSKEIRDQLHDMVTFYDDSMIIAIFRHGFGLRLCIHGMTDLNDINLIIDNDVFVADHFTPTEEQQKVIDRVNEIMKEEV